MEPAVRVDELEPWLKDALRVQIANVNKAVEKAKSDVDSQISSLKEVTVDLIAKSEKDSEKRNDRAMYKAAKAVGRLCLELQDVLVANEPIDHHSYEGLKKFSDNTAKLASNASKVREKWIGHIRPYYILDMMSLNASIDKLRRLGEHGWDLFSKDGGLLRRLEEIHARVEKTQDLVKSMQKQVTECNRVADEAGTLTPQISEAERQMESVAGNPKIAELRKIDNRLRELRGELLASGFRRLGRPLRKLEAMAGRGEYPMAPEVREKLTEYLKRPFTTFIHESDGYPYLKSVLRDMRQAVERKRLLLKQREERKVLERIDNVAEKNSLDGIHHEATMLLNERRNYLRDPECRELVTAYKQKRLDLKRLRSQHEDLEHRSKLLSDKAETLKTSLVEFIKGTEQLAEKLAGKPVKVELGQYAL
jgi:Fe-S cluster biosynthesis and repair protein YggX